jgi:hypothetical protein
MMAKPATEPATIATTQATAQGPVRDDRIHAKHNAKMSRSMT